MKRILHLITQARTHYTGGCAWRSLNTTSGQWRVGDLSGKYHCEDLGDTTELYLKLTRSRNNTAPPHQYTLTPFETHTANSWIRVEITVHNEHNGLLQWRVGDLSGEYHCEDLGHTTEVYLKLGQYRSAAVKIDHPTSTSYANVWMRKAPIGGHC